MEAPMGQHAVHHFHDKALVVNRNRIFAETPKAETAQTKMAETGRNRMFGRNTFFGRNGLFWPK